MLSLAVGRLNTKMNKYALFSMFLFLFLAGAVQVSAIDRYNLVHGYIYNNCSGDDVGTYASPLTLAGSPSTDVLVQGSGCAFSGSGQYLRNITINMTDVRTMIYWIKPNSPSSAGYPFSITTSSWGSDQFAPQMATSYNHGLYWYQPTTTTVTAGTIVINTSNGATTMVAYVLDGSFLKVYKNGVEVYAKATSLTTFGGGTYFEIAGRAYDNGELFKGTISQFSMFNYIFNSSDMLNAYNSGASRDWRTYNSSYVAPNITNNLILQSQNPPDITSDTIFNFAYVNITYNMTNQTLSFENISLNYALTSATASCIQYLNGSCILANGTAKVQNQASNVTQGNSTLYSFILGENTATSLNMNKNSSDFYHQKHDVINLNNANNIIGFSFLNITTGNYTIVFEGMWNSSLIDQFYFCNSSISFTAGFSPVSNANCIQVGTFVGSGFNHTHTENSSHNKISFIIIDGKVGLTNISVTPVSWMFIRGSTGAGFSSVYSINGSARTNSTYMTTNGGSAWSVLDVAVDSHIHFFSGTGMITYNASGYFNNTLNVSATTNDTYTIDPKPPVPASLVVPNGSNWDGRYMNITWINGESITLGSYLRNFTLELYNDDQTTLNRSIGTALNSSRQFRYDVYIQNLSLGTYYVKLITNSSCNCTSYDLEPFNLTSNAEINFFAGNGSAIMNFSINLTDLSTSQVYILNTTNGTIQFNIVQFRNYSALIDAPGFSFNTYNFTPNNYTQNYTYGLVFDNSVNITIRDEDTGSAITQNVSIRFVLQGSALEYNYITNTSTQFVYGLIPGTYDIYFTSTTPLAYGARSYTITINNRTTQSLTASLAQATFPAGFYIKTITDNAIVGASFSVSRLFNGTYQVVGTDNTDITGYVVFTLKEAQEYKFTIVATGYETREFLMKVYTLNSPYTFKLTSTDLNIFTDIYDFVSYTTTPVSSNLNRSRYNFTLSVVSTNGTIYNGTIRCVNESSIVSGSPSAITAIVSVNASLYSRVNCTYLFFFEYPGNGSIQRVAWDRMYYVTSGNNSVITGADDIRDAVNNEAWMTILAYVLIFFMAFIAFGWSGGNPIIVSVVMIVGIVVFVSLGWIGAVIGGIVAFIGALLLFMSSRGY